MNRCPRWCCWTPYACAKGYQCDCHAETAEYRAGQLVADFEDAARSPHRSIPEGTQRAILAAHAGYDGAKEVARQHRVPVGAVIDMWREGRRGD